MRGALALAGGAALLAAASPAAAARTAEYTLTDAEYLAFAENLEAGPIDPMPERGAIQLLLEGAEAADHKVRIMGIYCSAWKVENPVSQMLVRTLSAWDADGSVAAPAAGGPSLRVKMEHGATNLRCVEVKELKQKCLLRSSLSGTATIEEEGKAPRTAPVSVNVEQVQEMDGFCNGIAQGTSLLGRKASIALVEKLKALAAGE